jgi:hypothetical protein
LFCTLGVVDSDGDLMMSLGCQAGQHSADFICRSHYHCAVRDIRVEHVEEAKNNASTEIIDSIRDNVGYSLDCREWIPLLHSQILD